MDEGTRELLNFWGLVAQAAAVFWVWKDWQFGQFGKVDWARSHRKSFGETVGRLEALWAKFGGISNRRQIDFGSAESDELTEVANVFPTATDDASLLERKLKMINDHFGVGPSDTELKQVRGLLEHLVFLKAGVPTYQRAVRRSTFKTALGMIAFGLALQLTGALPGHWLGSDPNSTNTAVSKSFAE